MAVEREVDAIALAAADDIGTQPDIVWIGEKTPQIEEDPRYLQAGLSLAGGEPQFIQSRQKPVFEGDLWERWVAATLELLTFLG